MNYYYIFLYGALFTWLVVLLCRTVFRRNWQESLTLGLCFFGFGIATLSCPNTDFAMFSEWGAVSKSTQSLTGTFLVFVGASWSSWSIKEMLVEIVLRVPTNEG